MEAIPTFPMDLRPGAKLGPYEIVSPLGAGGMGEVYKARDPRLDRTVALKVSKAEFTERFTREARTVAQLNHPNICHLYDVGPNYLVMEFVDGSPLKGPLPVDKAIEYGGQILDALDAAHRKGITHRDLKPANVLVTKQGIKLLDFGLAKQGSGLGPDDVTRAALTMEGQITGTLQYMSPEQLQGKEADGRSDIFSFGCVLYEMLSGAKAFGGTNAASVIAAILEREPQPLKTAPPLDRVIRTCLAKDPDQRFQNALDLKRDLIWAMESELATTAASRSRLGLGVMASVTFLLLTAIVLGYIAYRHVSEEPPRLMKFLVAPPDQGRFNQDNSYTLAVSPDGNRVAYLATVETRDQIWLRDLGSPAPRPLPGTEGSIGAPFWSPDSRFIGFFAEGKLKRLDVAGGPAVTLCDAPQGRSGSWNKSDVIVFQTNVTGAIFRVAAAGGNASPATQLDQSSGEISHRFPWFLPDDRHFLYTSLSTDIDGKTGVYVGDLDSKNHRRVLAGPTNAIYVWPGYLLFGRDQTLMAQPFDLSKLTVTGEAVPVAEHLAGNRANARLQFSASQNGVIAYVMGVNGDELQLTWFDRSGRALGTVGPSGRMQWGTISPDGKTVAFDRQDSQTNLSDVWLHDLTRGTDSRFTFNSHNNFFPVWSPDGHYIAFQSQTGSGTGNIVRKAVSGVGSEEVLVKDIPARPDDWSRDGHYIVLGTAPARSNTGSDILVLPVAPDSSGGSKPFPYLQTTFNEAFAKLSPDGRWLAYRSDETKQYEIYVQTFPAPGGKWQISTNGGMYPVWSKDGKELFFIRAGKMMAVEVRGAGTKFEAGAPKPLFDIRFPFGNAWYDVGKDGRFLIPTPVGDSAISSIMVMVNWTAGLKK